MRRARLLLALGVLLLLCATVGIWLATVRHDEARTLATSQADDATDSRRFSATIDEPATPATLPRTADGAEAAAPATTGTTSTTGRSAGLPDLRTLSGRVVADSDRGVAGAEVLLGRDAPRVMARSDAEGRFEIHGIDVRHRERIWARAEGFTPSSLAPMPYDDAHLQDLVLRLGPPGGDIAGHVVNERGAPVADAQVALGWLGGFSKPWPNMPADHLPPPARRLTTGADGSFADQGLPVGSLLVQASAVGLSPCITHAEIAAGLSTPIELVLPASATIEGHVAVEGDERPELVQFSVGEPWSLGHVGAWADETGQFTLTGVPLGSQCVLATVSGTVRQRAAFQIESGGHYEWNVRLAPALELRGRVLHADGTPAVGEIVVRNWFEPELGTSAESAITDARGAFVFPGCGEVEQELTVQDGPTKTVVAWRHHVRASAGELEIRLGAEQPSASVKGVILGPDSRPLPQARVELVSVDADSGDAAVVAPSSGRFDVGPAVPGRYHLVARADGFADLSVGPFDLLEGEKHDLGTLAFAPPSRLRLTLEPAPGLDVRTIEVHGIAAGAADRLRATDDAGLVFLSAPLPAGEVQVVAEGGDAIRRELKAQLVAGRDTELLVALDKGVQQRVFLRTSRDPPPAGVVQVTEAAGNVVAAERLDWQPPRAGEIGRRALLVFACRPGRLALRVEGEGLVVEREVVASADAQQPAVDVSLD